MTGAEHYLEAERLLDAIGDVTLDMADGQTPPNISGLQVLATIAQVHATLAHADAARRRGTLKSL